MKGIVLHKGSDCNFVHSNIVTSSYLSPYKGKSQTMYFQNPPKIVGRMAIVGNKESEGPLGEYFKNVKRDVKLGQKTFEKAEICMLDETIRGAIESSQIKVEDMDLVISGDLLNQLTSSSYVVRNLSIPHLGVYSACSTMTESLGIAAAFINAGYYKNIACATVSHFATAERQFRYPLEYGCQRPPYAQWTVTAAGCTVLSAYGSGPRITSATIGKVIDFGTSDLSNMGAAMAPAAMDTMITFFKETNTSPKDYDLILTGDLGKLGSDILRDLMREKGYEMGQNYKDCGSLIYSSKQDVYQGGSGCGCSAAVINAYILQKMEEGEYNKIAFFATGALMSTLSCCQGETIPCVSHGVVIER